ncbi:MAG TPA: trehalose-phosphatase [Smithella sp.]|nr:trehalose-phosphatase [Smithella sp.]HQI74071.1 trehalose-phosphatase [Smithella sp.]
MSMVYLFGNAALSEMKNFIDKNTLFAFDLDGTLAPIVPEPSNIHIPENIRKEFALLNQRATVAVITGRSRSAAGFHLNVMPGYLIGNHGAEGLPGWETREKEFVRTVGKWQAQLDIQLPNEIRNGIFLENKGATISIHYRQATKIKDAHERILRVIHDLSPQPRRIGGKYIENLIPREAPDKGMALKLLMQHAGCNRGFFVGDDETDEDVFRMKDKNFFTVRVGRKKSSEARFYLRNQSEIKRLLREINARLDQNANSS